MLKEVASQQPVTTDYKGYEITDIPGSKTGAKRLSIDSGSYRIPGSQAAVAELLLDTNTPLTIKQMEDETGFTNLSQAVNALSKIGIIHSYQKGDTRRPIYHIASVNGEAPALPDEYKPYERKTRHHFKESVDISAIPEVITDPVHDPDPNLVDVPYISLPDNAPAQLIASMKGSEEKVQSNLSAVEFLKEYFEKGGREGFEQAHDHKGNPGRWVFIGFNNQPEISDEAIDAQTAKFHPRTDQMILG